MASLGTFEQQPRERLDYDINYARWLPPGDVIVDVQVIIDKPGIEYSVAFTGLRVKIWLWGGADKTAYKVTVIVKTSDAPGNTAPELLLRTKEVEFVLRVKDR